MIQWGVRGEALQTRRRRGGAVAAEGSRYQRLYALMRLTSMLEAGSSIVAVRWESSQDVDLLFNDGRELYIQVKNEAGAKITLSALGDILASFALDLMDSDGPNLQFLVVANAGTMDEASSNLRDGTSRPLDITNIAKILRRSDSVFEQMAEPELRDVVSKLSTRIDFNVPAGHAEGGLHSFESFARGHLINHGVRLDRVGPLIDHFYRMVETRGEMSREQLLDEVGPSVLVFGRASMGPNVDPKFVDRPAIIDQAALALFGMPSNNVALCGMGGCGKTQIAAALAKDRRCGTHFTDGVLWCVLGQTPNLPSVINGLLTTLEVSPVVGDADTCAATLRSVLSKKRCLLVVDDAWSAHDLTYLIPGDGLTRILVTCRDRRVGEAISSVVVAVGEMTESEALQLLRVWQPEDVELDESAASIFASRVGRLALALSLGAARARQGAAYGEILRDLEESESSIRALDADFGEMHGGDPEARRRLSLEACFDMSVRRLDTPLRAVLLSLALMPEDAVISAAEAAWIADIPSPAVTQRHMSLLARTSLVLERGTASGPSWYLHDLMRDYLRAAYDPVRAGHAPLYASGSVRGAHSDFVDRCGRAARGWWAEVPDIPYLDRYLTWHAEVAGRLKLLDEVISQERNKHPLWLRRLQGKGETALFLADTERSARIGLALVSKETQSFDGMLMVARAMVARACVVSKAMNVPPPLAVRLVAEGRWPYREGLSIADLAQGLGKVWTLGRLQPYAHGAERQQLEDAIFQELEHTAFVLPEQSSLDAVVPHASPAFRHRILAHARKSSVAVHALVLSYIAPYEPMQRDEWLNDFAARTFPTANEEVRAYTTLLQKGLVPLRMSIPRLMDLFPTVERSLALSLLSSLLPLLPEKVQEKAIEVLFVANDPSHLLRPVLQPALPITRQTLQAFRNSALDARDALVKAWMLGATLHAVTVADLPSATEEAMTFIRALPDSDWRKAPAMMSVSKVVPEQTRTALQCEAWNLARATRLREGLNNALSRADSRDFWSVRRFDARKFRSQRVFACMFPCYRRTSPVVGKNRLRAIHRFDSANNVITCAAFFTSPQ